MRILLVLFFSLAIVNAQLPAYLFRPLQIQSYLSEIHPQIKSLNALGDYSVDSIRSQPADILLASLIPTAFSDSVSERCHNDSVLYAHSIYRSTELWAMQSKSIFSNCSLILMTAPLNRNNSVMIFKSE